MAGKVKPVNVSPLIRCARYGFLILGCFYGSFRLSALRVYESTARELRHKMLHERDERKRAEEIKISIREFKDLAMNFGITDLPPGWEESIK